MTKGLIVLLVFTLLLVMPVQMPCGHLHSTCVTAPGPGGIYYAYYEVEPFGVTLVEMLIGRNLRIYYWTGRERHLLHKNGMQSLNVSAFVAQWPNLRQRKDGIIFGGYTLLIGDKPMSTTTPKAQVLPLKQMTDYQEGAIVSRQITKAEAGNVTLFAFDTGQELSEHTAPFDALVQVLEGQAEIIIAGQSFRVEMGEAIILPAAQPHAVKAPQRFKMLLTMIRA